MTQEEIDALPPTLVIPLKEAIVNNKGEQVNELVLCEPTGRQLRELEATRKTGMDSNFYFIGMVAGVPQTEVEKLPARLLTRALDYLDRFTQAAQAAITS